MDPIERRIKDLQNELEQVEQPDRLAIWNGITSAKPVKTGWMQPLPTRWIAAAAIALLLTGIGLGYWWNENRRHRPDTAVLADLPPQWQAKVREYQILVGRREQAVHVNAPRGAVLADELRELQLLDSLQQVFLADFESMPKDDRTAARCLHYYEQKIRILELILKEIQIRKHEAEKHANRPN